MASAETVARRRRDRDTVRNFCGYLHRLGYSSCTSQYLPEVGRYLVTGYDASGLEHFARAYTPDEMREIVNVSQIFWRYVK